MFVNVAGAALTTRDYRQLPPASTDEFYIVNASVPYAENKTSIAPLGTKSLRPAEIVLWKHLKQLQSNTNTKRGSNSG